MHGAVKDAQHRTSQVKNRKGWADVGTCCGFELTRIACAFMARSESPQRRTPVNPIPALRVIYRPGASLPDLNAYKGEIIEVRIASRYLTSRNSQVDTRQIWGSDIYTDDSDVLAILVHTGEYIVHAWVPKDYSGVSVLLRVLPSQSRYSSTDRHQLRSRLWASDYERCSLELVSSSLVKVLIFSYSISYNGIRIPLFLTVAPLMLLP